MTDERPFTTVEAVLEAEALITAFTSQAPDFGARLATAGPDVTAALVMFAERGIAFASLYSDAGPAEIRLQARQLICEVVDSMLREVSDGLA